MQTSALSLPWQTCVPNPRPHHQQRSRSCWTGIITPYRPLTNPDQQRSLIPQRPPNTSHPSSFPCILPPLLLQTTSAQPFSKHKPHLTTRHVLPDTIPEPERRGNGSWSRHRTDVQGGSCSGELKWSAVWSGWRLYWVAETCGWEYGWLVCLEGKFILPGGARLWWRGACMIRSRTTTTTYKRDAMPRGRTRGMQCLETTKLALRRNDASQTESTGTGRAIHRPYLVPSAEIAQCVHTADELISVSRVKSLYISGPRV